MLDKKKIIENLLFERNAEEIKYTSNEAIAEHRQQCDYLIKMLAEQPKIGEWISCSERLPERDGFYLATIDGEIAGVDKSFSGLAEFENGKWVDDEDDYKPVIAWMPLPEPYKGGVMRNERFDRGKG